MGVSVASVFVLVAMPGLPTANIEDVANEEGDRRGRLVQMEGWVHVELENKVLCSGLEHGNEGECVWLDIGNLGFTEAAAVHSCRLKMMWLEQYHHRKVRVAGRLRIGRGGHLGSSPAELDDPWVLEVLEQGDGAEGHSGSCPSIIEKYDTAPGTKAYDGLYYWGPEVNSFSACGSDESFWVSAQPGVLGQLRDFQAANTTEPYAPVRVQFRGVELAEPLEGFAAEYDGLIRINEIWELSADIPEECR